MSKEIIYKTCGVIGVLGCVAVLAADLIGIALHEAHNPISNTISMLAIGKYGWIQDWGIDILAVGFFALAIGLYTWKNSGTKWIIGLVILVLIGVDLIMIAEHNQYAGRPGHKIHRKLVYALAVLFPAVVLLTSFDLKMLKPYLKKFSFWIAGLWLVLAPLLPLMPDSLDGAYERLVCTLIVIWLGTVSYNLIYSYKKTKNT
ncbi:Protein of unknown function [Salegentibacter holothuriorum]|uniref:DUF998 domain-containing protein n=1 Tax=Salegentibacter holothuriorum TaxID=241145 RepID=A0A1T5BQU7_9FLAO|nr:DUF998 domain-containing protein [Salegentibacter holothuriorum]SKB49534.1 Protein of unknown function [Salegentibacter holothuriorum]